MKPVRSALCFAIPALFVACTEDEPNASNTTPIPTSASDGGTQGPRPNTQQDAAGPSNPADARAPVPHLDASIGPIGQADGGLPDPELSACADTFVCFAQCDDEACLDACAADANEADVLSAYELYVCAVDNQCQDDACLVQQCSSELSSCTGEEPPPPPATCGAIFDCFTQCSDEACLDVCASGDEAAAADAAALLSCALEAECGDETCLVDNCANEILACAGVDGTNTPDAGVSGCPAPVGPGTEHQGFIEQDETWTAESGPHIVTFSVDVRGATLTIEPCAQVIIEEGYHINVGETSGDPASLIARGEVVGDSIRPVTFTSQGADQWWGGITAWTTGSLELEYAVIERAGHEDGPGAGPASAIAAQGDDNRTQVIANVSLKHVLIKNSAGLGLSAMASGGFTDDSSDVTVTGAGSQGGRSGDVQTTYAAYVEAPAIHTLPAGSYTNNTIDAVLAKTPFALEVDETFPNRGVPYQMVSQFHMRPATDGEMIDLVIEPGVSIRFGGEDFTGASGLVLGDDVGDKRVRVTADGSAALPITLTSGALTPMAGDWSGLWWEAAPPNTNTLNYVTIEYAGGESAANGYGCGPRDNDSSLFIGWEPSESFISNSTIRDSAAGGIVSGWESDLAGPDLSASNTFSGIGDGCAVSIHKDAAGACPDNGGEPSCY
jgi:hypothetical protein